MLVQKYGGSSLKTLEHIKKVAANISNTLKSEPKILVVLSAMGENTNHLLSQAHALCSHPAKRELDMLITTGERVSIALLSMTLIAMKIKAISLTGSQSGILTSPDHGNARIIDIGGQRITEAFKQHQVVIIAGFQGYCPSTGDITSLGRGGSDLSAVALSTFLQAKCEIYTDVPGVMRADPRLLPKAQLIPQLSWDDMTRLAEQGAKVLHYRAAKLASQHHLPLSIRSAQTQNPGSRIQTTPLGLELDQACGLAHQTDLSLLQLNLPNYEYLADINTWLQSHSDYHNLFQCHGLNLKLLIKTQTATQLCSSLDLRPEEKTTINGLSSISLVGHGLLRKYFPELCKVWGKPYFIKARDECISFAIDTAQVAKIINRAYTAVFGEFGEVNAPRIYGQPRHRHPASRTPAETP